MSNEIMAGLLVVCLTGIGALVMLLGRTVAANTLLLTQMKREVSNLPHADDITALRVEVAQLNGKLDVMQERTGWISRALDRHERLLDAGPVKGVAP